MLRRAQYDDRVYECIFVRAGDKIMSEQNGNRIRVMFEIESTEDIARAEKVLGVYRELLTIPTPTPI